MKFNQYMNNWLYGENGYYKTFKDIGKGDCFISDEVNKVLVEFDNSIDRIKEMYKIFKNSKTIGRGLIYSRVISVVKIINGVNR